MTNECYFCRGIVLPHESNHFILGDHGDHQVAMHRRCAAGHDALETPDDPIRVTCPECGAVETV